MVCSKPCSPRCRPPGEPRSRGRGPFQQQQTAFCCRSNHGKTLQPLFVVARPGPPMALTGRAALAALIGALVVVVFRTEGVVLIVSGLVLAAVAADVVLAGRVRTLRMTRFGDTRVLLGETASVTLTVENTGRRPARATVRDSWQASGH